MNFHFLLFEYQRVIVNLHIQIKHSILIQILNFKDLTIVKMQISVV